MPATALLCIPVAVAAADHSIEEFADPAERPDERAQLAVDAARVRRLVAALPDERVRLTLIWKYGLFGCAPVGHREVSRRLAVSVGTAWNLEQAGLRALRARF